MAKFRKPRMRSYEALMKKSEKELKATYKKLYKQVYNQRRYLEKTGRSVDWRFDESYKAVRGSKSSYASKIVKLLERQRLQTYTTKGIAKANKKVAKNFGFKVDKKGNYYKTINGEKTTLTKDQVSNVLDAWHELVSDKNFVYSREQFEDLLTEALDNGWQDLTGDDLIKKMEEDITTNYRKLEEEKIKAYKPEANPFSIYM